MENFRLENIEGFLDIKLFLNHLKPEVISLIESLLKVNEVKVNFRLFCLYERGVDGDIVQEIKYFKTKNEVVAADFEQKESGWKLIEIQYLEIGKNRYNPLRASSFIELPTVIKIKHAVVNVKNEDNMCFKWATLSALYPSENHVDRLSNVPTKTA